MQELEFEAHVATTLEGHLLFPYIVWQHLETLASVAHDKTMDPIVPLP